MLEVIKNRRSIRTYIDKNIEEASKSANEQNYNSR